MKGRGAGRFAVVAARFNPEITDRLLESCEHALRAGGAGEIVTARVPGSFELPWAAGEFARSGRFDAVICLGAILRGETRQNDHIAAAIYPQLTTLSLQTGVPVIAAVLVPDTLEQAVARTKGDLDRGREAALAALEMAALRLAAPWRARRRNR